MSGRKVVVVSGKINWFEGVDYVPVFCSFVKSEDDIALQQSEYGGKKSCCGDNI